MNAAQHLQLAEQIMETLREAKDPTEALITMAKSNSHAQIGSALYMGELISLLERRSRVTTLFGQ